MSRREDTFTVESLLVCLAVTVRGEAVTRIDLNHRGCHPPSSRVELLVAHELGQYFAGERKEFTFSYQATGSDFSQRVWRAVQAIPYGETITYGELARRIGNSGAVRAVGTANGRNPLPLVIPCHRVVAADGKLGGYGGGLTLKRKLLSLEAANSPAIR
jgi:methylated-DNA-[protein]-cysteine S-methyltransferase